MQAFAGVACGTALLIVTGCSSSRYERSTGEFVDDQVLNHKVSAALSDQPVYKYADVHVHSYRGVVQLSGFVATDVQKQAAAEIARRVQGVVQVQNAIALAPLARGVGGEYIPGRTNDTNNAAAGQPDATTGRSTGAVTNAPVRNP